MRTAGFYIFYAINWLITLLPLDVLYLSSDVLYLFLSRFYRRRIVEENLRNSFPEKTPEELLEIEKKFYRHLADLFVETLKLTHMTNKELKRRFTLNNPELLDHLYKGGRDLAVVHSHYNNWEWLVCLPLYSDYKVVSIYKPLQDKRFDSFINRNRTRNNLSITPMTHVVREIIKNRKKNIRAMYGFIADQTPAKPDIKYWTQFMNQETPVYLGIEKIALKYDMAVVFLNVQKIRRGHYSLIVELLFESTAGLPEYLVTETHVHRLEKLIREKPEYWIWTHLRWKHKKEQQ